MNPKIKVEADISSAEQALAGFRQKLSELKQEANSATGKSRFETEFQAAGNALNKLMKHYDDLLKKMDGVEKSGKRYANILKEVGELTREAAKVSSKIEDFGSLKSNSRSSYFSGESAIHRGDMQRVLDQMRSDAAQARQEANQSKWANRAVNFASFAGGSMLGGGNMGSTIGSFSGGFIGKSLGSLSRIPGAGKVLGAFGSSIGGVVGGMADGAYPNAKNEAIAFSQLRKAIGASTVDFNMLRGAVRSASDGLGIAYTESVKLADSFVRTSNASETGDIHDSLRSSFGFARNYGIDPGAATNFFGSMRLFGATKNDQDQRKLAAMIGESVSKSGTTAKTAEVLDAVSSFVSNTGRTLLESNTAGYLSSLTSLMSSTTPGLKGNPTTAASVFDQANSTWMAGGARGEASKNYLLQTLSELGIGMNAYDARMIQEADMNSPFSKVFGKNTEMYKAADPETRRRFDMYASKYGNLTGFGLVTDRMERQSGGNSQAVISSYSGIFGGTMQRDAALFNMKRNGIDINGKGLEGMVDKPLGTDDGDKALKSSIDLQNEMINKMDNLIQVETDAKESTKKAVDTLDSIDKVLKDAFGPISKQLTPEPGKSGGFFSGVSSWWNGIKSDAATSKAWGGVDFGRLGLSSRQESVAKKIVDESRRQGVDPAVMLAMAMKESSLGENIHGPMMTSGMHKGDRASGVFQYMAKSSLGWDRMNDDENIRHAVADYRRNLSKFGSKEAAIAAHLTGPGYDEYMRGKLPGVSDGQSSAHQYVSAIEDYESVFNRKLSAQHMQKQQKMQASVNGTFVLQDQRGMQIADPVSINTTFPSPVPAGL